jgi:hypothetical protein
VRRVERGRGEMERERVVGKPAGDERVFIPWPRVRLADKAGSDAIPNAMGSEGGHRAATPDVASHQVLR